MEFSIVRYNSNLRDALLKMENDEIQLQFSTNVNEFKRENFSKKIHRDPISTYIDINNFFSGKKRV